MLGLKTKEQRLTEELVRAASNDAADFAITNPGEQMTRAHALKLFRTCILSDRGQQTFQRYCDLLAQRVDSINHG